MILNPFDFYWLEIKVHFVINGNKKFKSRNGHFHLGRRQKKALENCKNSKHNRIESHDNRKNPLPLFFRRL